MLQSSIYSCFSAAKTITNLSGINGNQPTDAGGKVQMLLITTVDGLFDVVTERTCTQPEVLKWPLY